MKRCPLCKEVKPLEDFPKDPSRKSGVHSYCRICRAADSRRRNRLRRQEGILNRENLKRKARSLGMTIEEAESIYEQVGEACMICGGPPTGNHRRLAMDHDHKTGKFRGLLCGWCNNGLGMFQDNPETLRQAARYLEGEGQWDTA